MEKSQKLLKAFALFDAANAKDPNTETYQGSTYPKEVLYALRMTDTLDYFAPNTPETLQLTARCQHLCRWEIPRNTYPMDRSGYLKWRQDLKKFHIKKAWEILKEVAYEQSTLDQVAFLLEKKQLKKNKDTQTLEDVICLVFLQWYLEPFAQKHEEEKTVSILQKTWQKMSLKGQEAAMVLPLSQDAKNLLAVALKA